jgi:integrase
VIDIDPATVAVLRAWKRERGALALALARDDSVVFGNQEGGFRQPERVSHLFREQQARCARMLGEDAPPGIQLHDLRHSMATIMIRDRENIKVVSERLGHASVTVTLSVYAHVLPGDQRQAAARFAALGGGGGRMSRCWRWYHRRIQLPFSVRMTPWPAAQREATGSRHRTVSTVTIL